jgi:hypothetical protein
MSYGSKDNKGNRDSQVRIKITENKTKELTATPVALCPVQSQWSVRPICLCNSTQWYFCLFDENKLGYSELCGLAPDFERTGV